MTLEGFRRDSSAVGVAVLLRGWFEWVHEIQGREL